MIIIYHQLKKLDTAQLENFSLDLEESLEKSDGSRYTNPSFSAKQLPQTAKRASLVLIPCENEALRCKSPVVEIILYDDKGDEIKVPSDEKNLFTIEIPLDNLEAKLTEVTCAYVATTEEK